MFTIILLTTLKGFFGNNTLFLRTTPDVKAKFMGNISAKINTFNITKWN